MANPTCVAVACGYLLGAHGCSPDEYLQLCEDAGATADRAEVLLTYLLEARPRLAEYLEVQEKLVALDADLPPWELEIDLAREVGGMLVRRFIDPELLVQHLAAKSVTVSLALAARFLIDNSESWLRGHFPNPKLSDGLTIVNYCIVTVDGVTTMTGVPRCACATVDGYVHLPWFGPYEMKLVGRNLPMRPADKLPVPPKILSHLWYIPVDRVRICGDVVAFEPRPGDIRCISSPGR